MTTGQYPKRRETDEQAAARAARLNQSRDERGAVIEARSRPIPNLVPQDLARINLRFLARSRGRRNAGRKGKR